MDLFGLIDQLEELLDNSIHVPASGKVLVDRGEIRRILEQMRTAAPNQVHVGQRIASERERILSDARAQARRLLEDAQAQANARLDEHALVQSARERARDIQAEAEARAAQLRAETNQYVIGQLSALETRLQRLLREVQAGQSLLTEENRALGGGSAPLSGGQS